MFEPKPQPAAAGTFGNPGSERVPPTGSTLQNPLPNIPIRDNINPNNGAGNPNHG